MIDPTQARIENAIERGIRNGDFDNLPGAGKPLELGDPHDENWWIKQYAQREGLNLAECLPPTVKLAKEAEALRKNIASFPNPNALRQAIAALNERIVADRFQPQRGPNPFVAIEIDEAQALQQWHATRAAVAPDTVAPTEPDAPVSGEARRPWWRRLLG